MRSFFILASTILITSSCLRKEGCKDPIACNYDAKAKLENGSCDYSCLSGFPDVLTGNIETDMTLSASMIYTLHGKVTVKSGVTLTIEPGCIIKASPETGALASMLLVEKGAKINAVGTESSPIIFTSTYDNIQLGQITGTNLDENDHSYWGGIIITGDAPISSADGDTTGYIEGDIMPGTYGDYGGNNPLHNAGTFKYVSIRYAGISIGQGISLSGLNLAGVGSQTTIDHVETVACGKDGIMIIGGTVTLNNIVTTYSGDDGIDIDGNFDGTIDNFYVLNNFNSDEGLEIDGPAGEGTTHTDGTMVISNGTVKLEGNDAHSYFRYLARGTIQNVDFGGHVKLLANYENNCNTLTESCLEYLISTTPSLIFQNSARSSIQIHTLSTDDSNQTCPVPLAHQTSAENAFPSQVATGADISEYSGWTWTDANDKF